MIMKDGKMHCALRIIDDCFIHLRTVHNIDHPAQFALSALENAKPIVELRRHKVSGRSLQVPVPCKPHRQVSLATRFVRDAFRDRKEHGSALRLANELLDLDRKTGNAWKMREDLHRRAEQNRAFAHFVR